MAEERFGLSAALTTPFDSWGQIDAVRAVAHARWCLAHGCSSVTLFGTTGEGASIAASERQALLAAFLAEGVEARQIVIGVMANAIADAGLQAKQALDAGCRGVLLAPPSYFKGLQDDGLFAWFAAVFETIGPQARGIYLYNIPSVTAVELSVDLIARLKQAFPAVVAGVKDSSGNWAFTQSLLAAHRDLAILIGDERGLAAGVRLGGQGAISGMANICPERMLPMVQEGRDDSGLTAFVDQLVRYPVIPAVKAMVAHRTGDAAWSATRAPLVALADNDARTLAGLLDRIGQTKAA
ncbi:dihydrodipicolinate synthase family protein [Labrys okinawensis]|uniref:Dihydrodipicolinate synthase family protein n=1 Tax=Labrys okinawensis TaxID=346911 RepID=A0A2S9Q6E7_9HYPH|nr:dihydrodipicolinate synthase family protein [Labrys okinawensis]PRH84907.1 dihydrodipicolinate synthase family protein [Labrys okinawensis]